MKLRLGKVEEVTIYLFRRSCDVIKVPLFTLSCVPNLILLILVKSKLLGLWFSVLYFEHYIEGILGVIFQLL